MPDRPFFLSSARLHLFALLALCGVLFFWQLDAYSLFNHTEAKQAEIARQIWVRHDWLTPYYNGEIYFDKPILLHWLIALGFPLVGVNEWAVRLPSAIAATVLILATWAFVRHFAGNRVGFLAATMLAANPFTFTLGRTGQHDMLLTCLMSLALYSWYYGYATGKTWGYLGFFGAIALAVLAKGPLALVLSSLILLVFLIWTGEWRKVLRRMPWRWGLLLFGGILLPWYGLMLRANGWTFLNQFVGYNNVDRFLSPNLQQSAPWYFYLLLLAVGFFPWNGLLPGAVMRRLGVRSLRPAYWQGRSPASQLLLFTTLWLVVVVSFMSVAATKLPWYVFPALPALAYLCARTWESQLLKPRPSLTMQLGGIGLIYLLAAIALALIPWWFADSSVIQAIAATGIPFIWAAIAAVAAGVVGVSALYRNVIWAWSTGAIAFTLITVTFVHTFLPALDQVALGERLIPIAQILQERSCENCPDALPAAWGVDEPSLNFYSRISYIKRFESPFELQVRLQQGDRLLLVTTPAALNAAGVSLENAVPIATSGEYELFALGEVR